MNNVFTAKLLQNLQAKKKGNKGFTLIELLVVVIIIGVLAAVALPNLLAQVGKARESEAKTALGALNRSQQAFRLEAQEFYGQPAGGAWADTETALGVIPGSDFYQYGNNTTANGDPTDALFVAVATDPDNSGARDFASAVFYDAGAFSTKLCVAANKVASSTGTGADPVSGAVIRLPGDATITASGDPADEATNTDCTGGSNPIS